MVRTSTKEIINKMLKKYISKITKLKNKAFENKFLANLKLHKFHNNDSLKQFSSNLTTKFSTANKGLESFRNMIIYWGGIAYFIAYCINGIIKIINIKSFSFILSIPVLCYFIWHFIVLIKITPKKEKLSKEEIEKRKEKHYLAKSFFRKLLLQEPITKFNPYFIAKIVDLFIILHFLSFVFSVFN